MWPVLQQLVFKPEQIVTESVYERCLFLFSGSDIEAVEQ